MAQLAGIIYNPGLSISARYAPTLNAAFYELAVASGIIPQVTRPDGDARTAAEQIRLGSVASWWLSDHYEGNWETSAAIDLNNQRAFRNWDEPRFLAIMAKHGWHNMDLAGRPFPSEPWHFANHGTLAPAGETGEPIPTLTITEGTEEMQQPIYARGDKLDVWYALYTTAEMSGVNKVNGSGPVYSGRRSVSSGERAIIEANLKVGGTWPNPAQKNLVTIPQATFDGINKLWGSA